MNRNFRAHQAEAMTQLHISRIAPSIRHTQTIKTEDDTKQQNKHSQEGIFKYKLTDSNVPSHVRLFNMSDQLYSAMEEQRLEACLDMSDQNAPLYDKERTLTFISIQIYR